ncbi:tetratricopeptide repeat protein [Saccharicrinis fermentans]|uniref:tetratricopeptide repeat protein n=1 Tax=Saccharicrinis fermentans TaxID=982 RepID=UPI0004B190A6|nr:tetratricopeptide repeat protein [Saccharicrinis fermentans]
MFFLVLFTHLLQYADAQDAIYDANGEEINVEAYFSKAEENIALGDIKEATRYINAVAEGYWNKKDYYKAIEYYIRSIKLNSEIGNESGIGAISCNLGMIHADLQDYETSLKYFNTAISIRKKLKETNGLISAHINASVVLNKLERYAESIENLEDALLLATENSDADQMKSCYGMLAETYEKQGDGEKMIAYYNLYRTFHELVERSKRQDVLEKAREAELKAQNLASQKRIKELELINAQQKLAEQKKLLTQKDTVYNQLMLEHSKSELANALINNYLQLKDLKISQSTEKLKREEIFVRVLSILVLTVLTLLLLLFYFHQQKRKSNKVLSKQNAEINRQHHEILEQQKELERYYNIISLRNEHITSSINYAKLIQQAVLGKKSDISALFKDAFIFFRPKDIVSGDFYWFKKVNGYAMLAVADCTGHGVPGALMSMLGINLINQITNSGIHEVDAILEQLSIGVNKALNENVNMVSSDGMDISLLCIDEKNKQMYFSGAKHNLYYIQDKKLKVLKGDRCSIGSYGASHFKTKRFTKYQVDISLPTSIYAFSDGIVDQFNESDDKKFMRSRLRSLLLRIYTKTGAEQKALISKTFNDWKGRQTQTDDVLLIGVNWQPIHEVMM